MTDWHPDPQFERHITRIITRAFEEAREQEVRENRAGDSAAAARGTLNSGGTVHAHAQRAAETFRAAGRRSITETVSAVTTISGDVTQPTVVGWLRLHLTSRFHSYAAARASSLAEELRRFGAPAGATEGFKDRTQRELKQVADQLERDLEIELTPLELRARLRTIADGKLPSQAAGVRSIDAFICHATPDKADVALPLAEALKAQGLGVWLDQYELTVGDSVYTKIDEGLRTCRFGVVIVSPSFFTRNWPRRELAALAALSDAEGSKKILPVWHDVDRDTVARFSPLLADVFAARTSDGLPAVVEQIALVLRS